MHVTAATPATPLVRALPLGIALVALSYLVPALWMLVAPHSFFDNVGPFGPYNSHYIGDAAAFQGGIGLALAASLWLPGLRPGALWVAFGATGLHVVNHWLDVNDARAGSNADVTDAVSLTILLLLIGVLIRTTIRGASR